VIENSSSVTHVVFDKTGTVTLGRPSLKETILVDPSVEKDHLLRLAASIECLSEHSIGHAICLKAAPPLPVSGFRAFPGKGVQGTLEGRRITIGNRALMKESGIGMEGFQPFEKSTGQFEKQGDTVVAVGWDRRLRALLVVSDVVRAEAVEVISELKKTVCSVEVMSGDNGMTTRSIASQIGADNALSEASPVMKRDYIAALQNKGQRVMMIGDGINDAPALTQALVGVAMGRGTDIARESADAVLIRDDLKLIPWFIGLSKKTYSIIRQNIFWAFFYNIVAIPVAVAGILHPIIAAGAMAASSLFVVGNSLRIRE